MGTTVLLQRGARLQFDGELLEVVQVEASRVTLRDGRGRWRTVGMAEFLTSAGSRTLGIRVIRRSQAPRG